MTWYYLIQNTFSVLWPSTTNHLHSKPSTADWNLTTPNAHHSTATNTTKEKMQTIQHQSTPRTITNPNHGTATRPREREGKVSSIDPHQNSQTTTYPHHSTTAKTREKEQKDERVREKRVGQESRKARERERVKINNGVTNHVSLRTIMFNFEMSWI